MAYQTGVATGPDQLLDAIRVFATANGWTQNRWATDGTGWTLSLQKGALHFHLRSATNEALASRWGNVTGVGVTGSTGFNAANAWWDQPGAIYYRDLYSGPRVEAFGLFNVSASNTYYLFADASPDMIACVAEVTPGVYYHLAFGELAKFGTNSGGAFVCGSFHGDATANTGIFTAQDRGRVGLPFNDAANEAGAFFYANVDSASNWYSVCSNYPATNIRARSMFRAGADNVSSLAGPWMTHAPNTLNLVTPMIPFVVFVERPSGYLSPFGYTPHLRYLNVEHFAPAEMLMLGTDTWMVFPAYSKGSSWSGMHGYAVRKVP